MELFQMAWPSESVWAFLFDLEADQLYYQMNLIVQTPY